MWSTSSSVARPGNSSTNCLEGGGGRGGAPGRRGGRGEVKGEEQEQEEERRRGGVAHLALAWVAGKSPWPRRSSRLVESAGHFLYLRGGGRG